MPKPARKRSDSRNRNLNVSPSHRPNRGSVSPKKIHARKADDTCSAVSVASPSSRLRISEVTERVGISASMIRAWERVGIVKPVRTESNYRLYCENDVTILQRAVYLRRYRGLNAPAILEQLGKEGRLIRGGPKDRGELSSLGPMLRRLRIKRGAHLQDVASAAGISVGFLSNIERSQASASVSTIQNLARFYGLNVLDFFDRAENPRPLVRPADRKPLSGGPGVLMELLAWGPIVMEPHLFRIAPGAHSGNSYAHEGQEFVFVLSGRFTLKLQEETFELTAGDSLYFESNRAHSFLNPGTKEAKILWINTPPTF